jgi:acyl carrier protein
MSGDEATITTIRRLVLEVLHVEVVDDDADLIETGVLDSLALVELIFRIEQECGVSIRLDEVTIDAFRSVRGIASLLDATSDRASDPSGPS